MKKLGYVFLLLFLYSCTVQEDTLVNLYRKRCYVQEPLPLLPTGDGEVFYTPSLYSALIPKNIKKVLSDERNGTFWYFQYSHQQAIILYDDLYDKWKDGDEGQLEQDSVERILEKDLRFYDGPKVKDGNHYVKKKDGIVLIFMNIKDKNVDEYINKTISSLKVSLRGKKRPTEKDVERWRKLARKVKVTYK